MLLECIGGLCVAMLAPGALYLLLLTVGAMLPARAEADDVGPPGAEDVRLAVVVPAHDEAAGIRATLSSLREAVAGDSACAIVVVADNCTDETAIVAAQAGVDVLERHDPQRRGKGPALAYAFERLAAFDWFLVIDADSRLDRASFDAMRAAMRRDAGALQCRYLALGEPDGEPRAHGALAELAWFAWNLVRPRGRARLGLSAGVLGNGFALSRATLARVPYDSTSIVEDADYHLRLLLAGLRVEWVERSTVRAPIAPDRRAAAVQRARWTGGRLALLRAQWLPCLRAIAAGRWRCADALGDLLLPPLTWLAAGAVALAAWPSPRVSACGIAMLAAVTLHLAVAMRAGRATRRHWRALLRLPFYFVWSLTVLPRALRSARGVAAWVRTPRGPHTGES